MSDTTGVDTWQHQNDFKRRVTSQERTRCCSLHRGYGLFGPGAGTRFEASGALEEITVTSRKREESLQDVSASVQAITGAQIKRQGLLSMEDVVRFLPNVSSIGTTEGEQKIIFRGVSDNPGAFIAASSAAVYLDEQPLTQFSVNPDPRLVDMERVEALAGRRATLYGDSSQSGTLRSLRTNPIPRSSLQTST